MVREASDPVVAPSSSIVLLQERFKQLQRLKEMRQERQLLKLLTTKEEKAFSSITLPKHSVQSSPSASGLLCPPPYRMAASPPQLSLSLWPIQQYARCSDSLSVAKTFCLGKKEKKMPPTGVKELVHLDEIDTSLHL